MQQGALGSSRGRYLPILSAVRYSLPARTRTIKYIKAYVKTDRLNTALMLCPARSCYDQQTRVKSLKSCIKKLSEGASPGAALGVHHRAGNIQPSKPRPLEILGLHKSCHREEPQWRRLCEPANSLCTMRT